MKTTLWSFMFLPSLKLFVAMALMVFIIPVYGLKYTQVAIKKNQTTTINNATNINKYGYGTMSSVGFTQPGLLKGQNVVIQGIDYSEDLKWMFLCGYVDPKENLTTGNTNSVVFILDMTQNDPVTGNPGKFIKEVILQTTTGGAYTGHAGGIAVTKNNLFVSSGGYLYRMALSKVTVSATTITARFDEAIRVPVNASYCSFDDDYSVLWVGEFEYAAGGYTTDASHHNGSYTAWTVGYKINETGASGYNASNGFKTTSLGGASGATPDYILWHCNKTQGVAAIANKIMLSQSYGRTNASSIHTYTNKVYGPSAGSRSGTVSLNGKTIPYWTLSSPNQVSAAPMTEGLAKYRSGNTYYMYIASESATYKYNGATTSLSTDPVYCTVKYKVASVTPSITVDPTSLTMSALLNGTATTTINVTGAYLTNNISITSNNVVVSVSPATIDKNGGTVTVTYKPVSTTGNSATLTFSSGSTTTTVQVTGKISEPVAVTINPNGGTYNGNTSFDVGDGKMVELSDISRTGYDFIGWGGNGSKYITGYQAYSSTAGDNCATQSFECSTPTAVAFNGTNKAVALGTDYKYKGTNYYTASVWAKMDDWKNYNTDTEGTAAKAMRIFSCSESGGWNIQSVTGCYIALHCNHANKLGNRVTTNVRLNGETSTNTYSDAEETIVTGVGQSLSSKKTWGELTSGWHMFTFTYSGNIVRFFIDGVLMGKTTAFGNSVNSGTLRNIYYHETNGIFLGAEAGTSATSPVGNYFKGEMKNACFLNSYMAGSDNTANDGDQIKRMYNSQKNNDGKIYLRVRKANDASLTLKALWRAYTYTVAYDANGGGGTMAAVSHTYDVAKTLTPNAFTRADYNFTGWNTKADGTGTAYADGQSVSNLSSVQGATVTLYAQWEKTTTDLNELPLVDALQVVRTGKVLQIIGLQVGTQLSLYDASGTMVWNKAVSTPSITLDNLPKGVYFLKNSNSFVKIIF
jgi:hypothetical protein